MPGVPGGGFCYLRKIEILASVLTLMLYFRLHSCSIMFANEA